MSWARIVTAMLVAVIALIVADKHGALRRPIPPAPVAVTQKPEPAVATAPAGFRPTEETPEDLPPGPGREETFYFCTACHGTAVIKAQGMRRDQWDDSLDWMQDKHKMPAPDAATRDLLLGYLSQALPPKPTPRRGWVNPFPGR